MFYFTPCSSQMVGVIVRLEKEAFNTTWQGAACPSAYSTEEEQSCCSSGHEPS